MDKRGELNNFLARSYELITCKYILAESKVVGVLKSIAASETLLAIIESALYNFNYEQKKQEYYTKSSVGNDNMGDYVQPENMKEMLALTFSLLMEIDNQQINFSDFLQEFFYEDGSFSESYRVFINRVIKPFRNALKLYMEAVIEGKLKNPKDELKLIKKANVTTKTLDSKDKVDEDALREAKELIEQSKNKVLSSDLTDTEKAEVIMIADNFIKKIETSVKEDIRFAFICYKQCVLLYKRLSLDIDGIVKYLIEGNIL